MDQALAAVAEQLVDLHPEVRSGTVIRVLTECVEELPESDSHFIMQAASARLALLDERGPGRALRRDVLDVSLHDWALHDEVALTASLMAATNESDDSLHQGAVDEVLGVIPRQRGPRTMGRPTAPGPAAG